MTTRIIPVTGFVAVTENMLRNVLPVDVLEVVRVTADKHSVRVEARGVKGEPRFEVDLTNMQVQDGTALFRARAQCSFASVYLDPMQMSIMGHFLKAFGEAGRVVEATFKDVLVEV